MNPEHKRIVELAAGWEGSAATVTVSPADAALLQTVGCPAVPGKRQGDPLAVAAPDLCAAARRLAASDHATPDGAQPTPNTQSAGGPELDGVELESHPLDPDATDLEPAEAENLDSLTVAELKAKAEAEGIDITGHAKKADIIAAIRAARGE